MRRCQIRSESSRGFTIIELLVVITIVTLLLTILLPSMDRAREQARRVQCESNLRQVYQYFFAYQTEQAGWLPTNDTYVGAPDWTGMSPASPDDEYSSTAADGWGVMLGFNSRTSNGRIDAIPVNLLNCPSMDFRWDGVNDNLFHAGFQWVMHYGYRYNSSRVDRYNYGFPPSAMPWTYYGREPLTDPRRTWRPFITDACGYRLKTNPALTGQLGPIGTQSVYFNLKWAHTDGGNVLRHDGAVRWYGNQVNTDWYWYSYASNWPTYGDLTHFGCPIAGWGPDDQEISVGLDGIFKDK